MKKLVGSLPLTVAGFFYNADADNGNSHPITPGFATPGFRSQTDSAAGFEAKSPVESENHSLPGPMSAVESEPKSAVESEPISGTMSAVPSGAKSAAESETMSAPKSVPTSKARTFEPMSVSKSGEKNPGCSGGESGCIDGKAKPKTGGKGTGIDRTPALDKTVDTTNSASDTTMDTTNPVSVAVGMVNQMVGKPHLVTSRSFRLTQEQLQPVVWVTCGVGFALCAAWIGVQCFRGRTGQEPLPIRRSRR